MYDYFYGAEAEQFSFYRIPKVLFTEERFRTVSAEAKVLYGLLLDRMSLSCKNGWLDKERRVYIIFTIEEVMTALGCADQKAGKLLHELESKCRLIERKRQGLGKPNLIYVKNFVDKAADNPVDNASGSTAPSPESRFQNRENHDSGAVKITDQESLKSRSNNTENNDTDFSDTDSFPFTSFRRDHGREAKGNEAALRERYRELIAENIAYDALLTDYPYEQDTLEEILELLVDVVCTTKSSVRISGDDKPAEVVRSRFLKLNSEHIRFVVGGLKENTTRIRNIYDTKHDADGRERRVLNSKETTLAQQKQQAIRDAFRDWIWRDPDRRHTLVARYNELFNSTRPREYDGSHITFAGMNPEIRLREHQLNAVAHVLYGGNTLLAHEVGAGKTFEMVAAAMESKRLGLCHKSLFVVPNHLTKQWSGEFLRLYPSANILVATKKDFEPKNRKKFCARIATGE